MSDHPFIYGIDFCFDPTNPGPQDPEGHYTLGFGFIERDNESSVWRKVAGFTEAMVKNNGFGFNFYDLSRSLQQIDFATIDLRPATDSSGTASKTSPFSGSDEEKLRAGMTLSSQGALSSCGCGDGSTTPSGNHFDAGTYALKNTGDYEMTIEIRITSGTQTMRFKCDPRMQVGSGG